MNLRPINRIKHVVDFEGALTTTQSVIPIASATDTPTLAATASVETGCTINGIYLHVEVLHSSGTGRPNVYLGVFKSPGSNLTAPQADAVGSNDNKKYVIHQEMIMMSGDAGNGLPRPLFNGVIVIPKHMRRFGPDDELAVFMKTKTASLQADMCGQCHYKEFR